MCGIVGIYGFSDKTLVKRMCDRISHRGPDEDGYYIDDKVSLGMRRLSSIDLSTGSQPILSENESIIVVFNGEIYNFRELREELEQKGHRFSTNSDTEVIVHAYEDYGYDCLKRFNGMFAIALWDTNRKELLLARDRIGIKPLYYTLDNANIVFASEIKPILEYGIRREVDEIALANYFILRYVPAPRTMFKGVNKLEPGHYMVFNEKGMEKRKYWDLKFEPLSGDRNYFVTTASDMLRRTVNKMRVTDVPVGAYLSGGIDSSVIVALMSELQEEPVKTFSVGFEGEYDETPYARIVAEHLGTEHHEIFVDEPDILPEIFYHFNDPIADPAVIPTYVVSKQARKEIKVVLAGEGGDEAFGGYEKYAHELKMLNMFSRLPEFSRSMISGIAKKFPETSRMRIYAMFVVNKRNQQESYSFRLRHRDLGSEYMISGLSDEVDEMVTNSFDKRDYVSNMIYFDIKHTLPENLLMKWDRTTIANSIEARFPFLDHELLYFAYNIPYHLKIKNNGKYILRKVASELLPREIVERKKHGFDVPIKEWFKSDTLDEYLSEEKIKDTPYLYSDKIQEVWGRHRRGKGDYSILLWKCLCYVMWYDSYIV